MCDLYPPREPTSRNSQINSSFCFMRYWELGRAGSLPSLLLLSQASVLTVLSLLAGLRKHLKVLAFFEWPLAQDDMRPQILSDLLVSCFLLFCPLLPHPWPVTLVEMVCLSCKAKPPCLCPAMGREVQGDDGKGEDRRPET